MRRYRVEPSGVLIDDSRYRWEWTTLTGLSGSYAATCSQPERFWSTSPRSLDARLPGVCRRELMEARKVRDGGLRTPSCRFCMSSRRVRIGAPVKVVDGVTPNRGKSITVDS